MESLSRILIDSFDVDVQVYMDRVLEQLARTSSGRAVAEWATENAQTFQMLLRLLSVAVQRVPDSQHPWVDAGVRNLKRLPISIHRTVFNPGSSLFASKGAPEMPSSSDSKEDSQFAARFEDAVERATEDELAQVASLTAQQVQEWALSPEKLRPHLLNKWSSGKRKFPPVNKDVFRSVASALGTLRQSVSGARNTDMLQFLDVISNFMDDMKSRLTGSLYENGILAVINAGQFDIRSRLKNWLQTPSGSGQDNKSWAQVLDDPLFGGYYQKEGLAWDTVSSGQVASYLTKQFATAPIAEVVRWAWINVPNVLHDEWQSDAVRLWKERRIAAVDTPAPDPAALSPKQRRDLLLKSTGVGNDGALVQLLRLHCWLSAEISLDELVEVGGDAFTKYWNETLGLIALPLVDWLSATLDKTYYYEWATVDTFEEGEEIKLSAALMLEGFRPMVEIYHARKAAAVVHELKVLGERSRLRKNAATSA